MISQRLGSNAFFGGNLSNNKNNNKKIVEKIDFSYVYIITFFNAYKKKS
jgi:hypothetical protein